MQHDVNQHSVQTGGTFYKYDAAIILTSFTMEWGLSARGGSFMGRNGTLGVRVSR